MLTGFFRHARLWVAAAFVLVHLSGTAGPTHCHQLLERPAAACFFVTNQGQVDREILYYTVGSPGTVFITSGGDLVHVAPGKLDGKRAGRPLVRERLHGARPVAARGGEPAKARVNYLVGGDRSRWRTGLTCFRQVGLGEVYPGVSLHLRLNQGRVEKVFTVKPGADPNLIWWEVEGPGGLHTAPDGRLTVGGPDGTAHFSRPVAYQDGPEGRRPVEIAYRVDGRRYGFSLGDYDTKREMVIDPMLSFSSFLGGEDYDYATAVATDSQGNVYVTGYTHSLLFPTTPGAYHTAPEAYDYVFVSKFSGADNSLVYSTFLGGDTGNNRAYAIAVDSSGRAFVGGDTNAGDFPTAKPLPGVGGATKGDYWDGFVAALSPAGDALYFGTHIGDSIVDYDANANDVVTGVAVNSSGTLFVAGITQSTADEFPLHNAADNVQSGKEAFACKIDIGATASSFAYSTYLGGDDDDEGLGVAVDGSGNAYITGHTESINFPTQAAFQGTFAQTGFASANSTDAFLTKLSTAGAIMYSTFIGGYHSDEGHAVAVDASGKAYVVGFTESNGYLGLAAFPTLNPLYPADGTMTTFTQAFLTVFNPSGGSLAFSTFFGGNNEEEANGLTLDSDGNIHICGLTRSDNMPTKNAVFSSLNAGSPVYYDAFAASFNPSGNALLFSTYLGGTGSDIANGIAADPDGNLVLAGRTASSDFPMASPYQGTPGGGSDDAFVTRINGPLSAAAGGGSCLELILR